MRILYIHRGYFPALAGAEMMARLLAEQMHRRGHTVQLCMSTSAHQAHPLIGQGVPLMALPSFQPQVVQDVLPWQPDIIHAVDAVDPLFPRAALNLAQMWQLPFVITPASAIETWQDIADTMTVCRSAKLIFVLTNEEAKHYLKAGIAAEQLRMTGQGPYLVGTADPEGFRQRYHITGPLVLFLGRKVRFKGYHLLLEASRYIWAERPDTTILLMGPRWDDDCLDVFHAFANPRIIEVDVTNDDQKVSALQACDVLCLPTMVDVFPLVFVEAWACGKPVISTPFPGVQEVIRANVDGLIVEPDAEAIARGIVTLLNDPALRKMLGQAGYERVQRELNWPSIAETVEAGYTYCCTMRS